MSESAVSVDMFKIWADSQRDMMIALTSEMKEIRKEQAETTKELKETNSLLRADINTTKAILNQHITEYNHSKLENNKRFADVFKRLEKFKEAFNSREGVYTAAKYIKWAGGIILIGGLTASGAHLYDKYFIKDPRIEIKKDVKPHD